MKETMLKLLEGTAKWPLYLHGSAGSGKTCALRLLVALVSRSKYDTFHDFLVTLREYGSGKFSDANELTIWNRYRKDFDLTVIDEVGSRTPSDFQYETMCRLLDAREDKPFVVASNLTLMELSKLYDDRVSSRCGAGTVYKMAAGDRRF